MLYRRCYLINYFLLVCIVAAWPSTGFAGRTAPLIPAAVADRMSKGMAQDLIVLFEDSDVEAEMVALRQSARKAYDDEAILAVRRERYHSIKQSATALFTPAEVEQLRDYDHLPMSLLHVKSRSTLDRILADPRVKAIYEDSPVYPHLASSLPFIGQPAVAGAGYTGSGKTVVVIDTGIDFTNPAFGSCTAPLRPTANCRISAYVDDKYNDILVVPTDNHGTNVAGIVAGVAPGAQLAAFNAFPNGSATASTVIAGINWAINNKNAYNISVLNMSLGDSSKNTAACTNGVYSVSIRNLRALGTEIIPVASSGNDAYVNNAYIDGISSPACTPGVVSVGAVYDANIGGWNYGYTCTDATSAADKIACFSNSASYLTMLAPGAQITAAGITLFGTSQASPHVAGSIAVMRAAYPADSLVQTVNRLTTKGVPVTDSRNGFTIPRLNLLAAIDATAPSVSLTAPASGSSVSGTVTVAAGASDIIGVNKVEFYVNAVLTSTSTTVPYMFSWNTTALGNGAYTLSAKAYNAAGIVGQSGNVVVTVVHDSVAPIVSLTTPVSGSTVSGSVTVTASASDNIGVSRVEFYVNGMLVSTRTSAPYSFSWDTRTVASGITTLSAKAYDVAGNIGQSGSVTVTVSQALAVPALSSWGILVAVLCLAGMAGATNSSAARRRISSKKVNTNIAIIFKEFNHKA
jgi:subtilisin family serine protease